MLGSPQIYGGERDGKFYRTGTDGKGRATPKEVYPTLYEALGKDFTDTIASSKTGVRYKLPYGVYEYVGAKTSGDEVRTQVRAAVKATGHKGRILVIDYRQCFWSGLDRDDASEDES